MKATVEGIDYQSLRNYIHSKGQEFYKLAL